MFFAHDSGMRPKEAPTHMLLAMGITAALCIAIGVYPEPLYALLPYPVDFTPYTTSHVIGQLQLLLFALFAFAILMRTGIHPPELRAVNLDTDWSYRWLLPRIIRKVAGLVAMVWNGLLAFFATRIKHIIAGLYHSHGPEGRMASRWPTGAMVIWISVLLGATLLVSFFG